MDRTFSPPVFFGWPACLLISRRLDGLQWSQTRGASAPTRPPRRLCMRAHVCMRAGVLRARVLCDAVLSGRHRLQHYQPWASDDAGHSHRPGRGGSGRRPHIARPRATRTPHARIRTPRSPRRSLFLAASCVRACVRAYVHQPSSHGLLGDLASSIPPPSA